MTLKDFEDILKDAGFIKLGEWTHQKQFDDGVVSVEISPEHEEGSEEKRKLLNEKSV